MCLHPSWLTRLTIALQTATECLRNAMAMQSRLIITCSKIKLIDYFLLSLTIIYYQGK